MAISWEVDCVELLRTLIGDFDDDNRLYSDDRLRRVLVTAAFQVLRLADFDQDYVVDISEQSITPDPTDRTNGTHDDDFVNLICLKAACIIDTGRAIAAAKSGFAGKDMNTSWDLKGVAENTIALLDKGWCKAFEVAIEDYLAGDGSISAAVMGPFRLWARDHGYHTNNYRGNY